MEQTCPFCMTPCPNSPTRERWASHSRVLYSQDGKAASLHPRCLKITHAIQTCLRITPTPGSQAQTGAPAEQTSGESPQFPQALGGKWDPDSKESGLGVPRGS